MQEIEVRAPIANVESILSWLSTHGYRKHESKEQLDIIHDFPDATLFKRGEKIRLRIEGESLELTYKGQFMGSGDVSRRLESNIALAASDVEAMGQLLEALGYPECFRIPKLRHKYSNDEVVVTIDEWPIIGHLVEVEGEEAAVKNVASHMAPEIDFRNYRLKELLESVIEDTGKSLGELVKAYESSKGINLGRWDLLISE